MARGLLMLPFRPNLDRPRSARDPWYRTRGAARPSGPSERYDFFLSRRGSVAAIAQEVADVLD